MTGATCVYTTKGMAIEQILIDAPWCGTVVPETESYFDAYVARDCQSYV